MQTFFKDYLNLLQDCHNGILEALEGLPQAALDMDSRAGHEFDQRSGISSHRRGKILDWGYRGARPN